MAVAVATQAIEAAGGQSWKVFTLWGNYRKAVASGDAVAVAVVTQAMEAAGCYWPAFYEADGVDARHIALQNMVGSNTFMSPIFLISWQTQHLFWTKVSPEQQAI